MLGNDSPTEGVGYKPIELCTVMTDGSVEAHDVLRIAGDGVTRTTFNIFEHAIDDVRNQPRWKAAREASINLCAKCRQCKFMNACGGGYLPHRFSKKKRLRQSFGLLQRSLFDVREHAVRPGEPSLHQQARRGTSERARRGGRRQAPSRFRT
jgi:radical SAM protein with 4Fe4S-binding SPASM domain